MNEDKLTHREAGVKHNVSHRLVQKLVWADKNDDDFLISSRARFEKHRTKLRKVIEESLSHLNSATGLKTASQVKESIMAKFDTPVSCQYICQVLRKDLGARYTRVQKIPYLGNTTRCLLLRQRYAIFMLK